MSSIHPRRAADGDLEEVLSIITAAFAQDPLWSHALASADGGTEHHARFWRHFIEGAMPSSWVWLTEGGEATSVWIPPGGTELNEAQEEELGKLARQLLGRRAEPYFQLLEDFDVAHPRKEAHYYMSLLGTHPEHSGRGIGMDLLRHNLGRSMTKAFLPTSSHQTQRTTGATRALASDRGASSRTRAAGRSSPRCGGRRNLTNREPESARRGLFR